MLSVNFKLTTAQTRLLLGIVYFDYSQIGPDLLTLGRRREGVPDLFITTVRCLIARDLVEHRQFEFPAYIATEGGKALAGLILKECHKFIQMADGMDARLKKLAPVIAMEKRHAEECRKIAMRRKHTGVQQ